MFVSASLFVLVSIICYKVTGFKITEIPLSQWGVTHSVSWLWNGYLIILGMSCFFNIQQYLIHHPHLQYRKQFTCVFLLQCISMSLLGVFVKGHLIHNILAYTYFFSVPLTIFLLTSLNRIRLTANEWLVNTILSTTMIVFPLTALFIFSGKGIAEILHSLLFLIWNIYILKENKL